MTARKDVSRVRFRARALAPAAAVCLLAVSAWAAPIPVDNPSFEDLPDNGLPIGCGGCRYSEDHIPGWQNIPFLGLGLTSGQFQPGTEMGNTTYFDVLSDGPTSAYSTNGCIEQVVGVVVQPGVVYTLLVDVGWRKDAQPFGLPRLRVNNVLYDAVGTAVLGGWATFTATYTGQAEDAGLPISICLTSVTLQGNFDNVRLSDSIGSSGAVPPPPQFRLAARPNPFGAVTQVGFTLTRRSPVVLRVFDVSGRAVRTLLAGADLEAGTHEAVWDGRDDAGTRLESGLYFLRIATDEGGRTGRVMLVR